MSKCSFIMSDGSLCNGQGNNKNTAAKKLYDTHRIIENCPNAKNK